MNRDSKCTCNNSMSETPNNRYYLQAKLFMYISSTFTDHKEIVAYVEQYLSYCGIEKIALTDDISFQASVLRPLLTMCVHFDLT